MAARHTGVCVSELEDAVFNIEWAHKAKWKLWQLIETNGVDA